MSINNQQSRALNKSSFRIAEECHAEMIYGELTFMSFILTMINDPGLLAVIKAGLKLRSVYNTYA